MENQEFQKHIISRLQKLEEETFDGTYEQNYSSRQQAERITDGITDAHHIGKKSKEVLKQELNSHIQNYGNFRSKDEEKEWYRKKQSLIDQLREATK